LLLFTTSALRSRCFSAFSSLLKLGFQLLWLLLLLLHHLLVMLLHLEHLLLLVIFIAILLILLLLLLLHEHLLQLHLLFRCKFLLLFFNLMFTTLDAMVTWLLLGSVLYDHFIALDIPDALGFLAMCLLHQLFFDEFLRERELIRVLLILLLQVLK